MLLRCGPVRTDASDVFGLELMAFATAARPYCYRNEYVSVFCSHVALCAHMSAIDRSQCTSLEVQADRIIENGCDGSLALEYNAELIYRYHVPLNPEKACELPADSNSELDEDRMDCGGEGGYSILSCSDTDTVLELRALFAYVISDISSCSLFQGRTRSDLRNAYRRCLWTTMAAREIWMR